MRSGCKTAYFPFFGHQVLVQATAIRIAYEASHGLACLQGCVREGCGKLCCISVKLLVRNEAMSQPNVYCAGGGDRRWV